MDINSFSELEKQFPRIARNITLLWGFPEFTQFMNKLYIDERGNRQGFPKEVMEELMLLHSIHVANQGSPLFARNDYFYIR
jgi:hypothetical protein